MRIIPLIDNPNYCITYLIENNDSYIIVDPSYGLNKMAKKLEGKKVEAILLTHGHFDHFAYLKEYLDYFKVKVYLHPGAFKKVNSASLSVASAFGHYELPIIKQEEVVFLKDEDILNLIGLNIEVLTLPGHTSCSVGFVIDKEALLGDTLFLNSTGRFDLPTGNYNALKQSLNKLKEKIDDDVIVYSGHDEPFRFGDVYKKNSLFIKMIN